MRRARTARRALRTRRHAGDAERKSSLVVVGRLGTLDPSKEHYSGSGSQPPQLPISGR